MKNRERKEQRKKDTCILSLLAQGTRRAKKRQQPQHSTSPPLMSYLRPPYFKAQTIADGIKMMTPTTWPVVIGFATTATLLLYAHSKLATNPAVRAKSCMSSHLISSPLSLLPSSCLIYLFVLITSSQYTLLNLREEIPMHMRPMLPLVVMISKDLLLPMVSLLSMVPL